MTKTKKQEIRERDERIKELEDQIALLEKRDTAFWQSHARRMEAAYVHEYQSKMTLFDDFRRLSFSAAETSAQLQYLNSESPGYLDALAELARLRRAVPTAVDLTLNSAARRADLDHAASFLTEMAHMVAPDCLDDDPSRTPLDVIKHATNILTAEITRLQTENNMLKSLDNNPAAG